MRQLISFVMFNKSTIIRFLDCGYVGELNDTEIAEICKHVQSKFSSSTRLLVMGRFMLFLKSRQNTIYSTLSVLPIEVIDIILAFMEIKFS